MFCSSTTSLRSPLPASEIEICTARRRSRYGTQSSFTRNEGRSLHPLLTHPLDTGSCASCRTRRAGTSLRHLYLRDRPACHLGQVQAPSAVAPSAPRTPTSTIWRPRLRRPHPHAHLRHRRRLGQVHVRTLRRFLLVISVAVPTASTTSSSAPTCTPTLTRSTRCSSSRTGKRRRSAPSSPSSSSRARAAAS